MQREEVRSEPEPTRRQAQRGAATKLPSFMILLAFGISWLSGRWQISWLRKHWHASSSKHLPMIHAMGSMPTQWPAAHPMLCHADKHLKMSHASWRAKKPIAPPL